MSLQICPACKSDNKGAPIPDEYFVHDRTTEAHKASVERHLAWNLSGECSCLPYGDKAPEDRFFSRIIGFEVPGVYDGTLFWGCADCGHRWPRFAEGDRLHNQALKAIADSTRPQAEWSVPL